MVNVSVNVDWKWVAVACAVPPVMLLIKKIPAESAGKAWAFLTEALGRGFAVAAVGMR